MASDLEMLKKVICLAPDTGRTWSGHDGERRLLEQEREFIESEMRMAELCLINIRKEGLQ